MTLAAATAPRALWYATRGSGAVSLVLLTAIVVLGIAGAQRLRTDRWPRFLVVGLHRNLTLVTLAFLGAHIGTAVADSYAPIALRDAVLPFASAYRPVWLGLGAVAFDLLLALTATSLLRARIGHRTWRSLHWLAYASWPVALVHALGTGSDARLSWLQALAVATTAVVAVAIAIRVAAADAEVRVRVLAAAATLLVPLGTLLWYRNGPSRRGWSSRTGTPAALLASRPAAARVAATRPAVSGTAPQRAQTLPAPPYTATLTGRLRESGPRANGLVLVDIRGRTRGVAHGVLWIRLQGRALDGGGVAMTASGASYGTPTAPRTYLGRIVALQGTQMVLALRGARDTLELQVDLRIDPSSQRVSGTIAAAPGPGMEQ